MVRFLLLSTILFLLPGCILSRNTLNEPLDPERISQLEPGTTTAKELVELLGAPTEVIQLGRRSAYRYDFSSTKYAGLVLIVVNMFNSDTRSDRLWVFFDEHDVLSHSASSLRADAASYSLPWTDVREE